MAGFHNLWTELFTVMLFWFAEPNTEAYDVGAVFAAVPFGQFHQIKVKKNNVLVDVLSFMP